MTFVYHAKYRSATGVITHTQYVQRLYKQALKTAYDWRLERLEWRHDCMYLRSLFESNRNVQTPKQIMELLIKTEETLKDFEHPEPYNCILLFI